MFFNVPYLLPNGETQRAEILRDDFPWDKEDFRLKNVRTRRAVSKKIACILAPHSTLAVNFISLQFDFFQPPQPIRRAMAASPSTQYF